MNYSTIAKSRCRKWVWDLICEYPPDDVAIMPSIDGREIFEALGRGFQPSQLHVIDKNPAVVATLQRTYPGINTYGVEAARAIERMSANGVDLLAAHIDYCSNVCPAIFNSLRFSSINRACWRSMFFVTVLRGRESGLRDVSRRFRNGKTLSQLKNNRELWCSEEIEPTEIDAVRLQMMRMITFRNIAKVHPYKSSNGQTFLTVMFTGIDTKRPDVIEMEKIGRLDKQRTERKTK